MPQPLDRSVNDAVARAVFEAAQGKQYIAACDANEE